jgi:hypothetical protein
LEKPKVLGLAVSKKPPRKSCQKMGEDVLESDPDEWGQEENELGEGSLDLGKTPG